VTVFWRPRLPSVSGAEQNPHNGKPSGLPLPQTGQASTSRVYDEPGFGFLNPRRVRPWLKLLSVGCGPACGPPGAPPDSDLRRRRKDVALRLTLGECAWEESNLPANRRFLSPRSAPETAPHEQAARIGRPPCRPGVRAYTCRRSYSGSSVRPTGRSAPTERSSVARARSADAVGREGRRAASPSPCTLARSRFGTWQP
jgi:hypothetical protein